MSRTYQRVTSIAVTSLFLSTSLYAQSAPNEFKFCSHLPIVIATLKDQPFPPVDMKDPESSKSKRTVSLKIFDANPTDAINQKLNCVSDPSENIDATMHYRGSSSLGFPKHQFGVKLSSSWNPSKNPSLKTKNFLGMPYGGKSWIFSAEQANLDGTYLRNSLTFYLFNKFNELTPHDHKIWSPRTRFFELFIQNPGANLPTYTGLYVVAEAIQFNDHRIDLQDNVPAVLYKIDQPSLKSCDIPVKDKTTTETFSVYDYQNVTPIDLDKIDCKKALPDFWPDAFSYWTKSVTTLEPDKEKITINGQEQTVDIKTDPDSFAISFLINEFIKDPDGYNRNTFFYQTYDNKNSPALTMYAGPLWDKNLAYDLKLPPKEFGLLGTTSGYMGYGVPYSGVDDWTFKIKYRFWKDTLQQPAVQNKICEYWTKAISQQILTANSIIYYIQNKVSWIDYHTDHEKGTTTPVERDCNQYFPFVDPSKFPRKDDDIKNCYPVFPMKIDKLIQYINGRMDYMTKELGQTQVECQKNIKKIVSGTP